MEWSRLVLRYCKSKPLEPLVLLLVFFLFSCYRLLSTYILYFDLRREKKRGLPVTKAMDPWRSLRFERYGYADQYKTLSDTSTWRGYSSQGILRRGP
jgi:hypothetical protein